MPDFPTTLRALTRECSATRIPSGETVFLPEGTIVRITQSLGGSYTVEAPSLGGLYRIAGPHADALGLEVAAQPQPDLSTRRIDLGSVLSEDLVYERLRSVYDPEIPVNVVDLGLIYDLRITPLPEGGNLVEVKMTLTAPGCGMGASIASDARARIMELPSVKEADVQLVWEPMWNPQMMSEDAKKLLGIV
jgi:probable FeS assembly SUF system protein SufT